MYTDRLQELPVLNLWCNACVHTHAHIHTQTTKFVYSECKTNSTVQSKFMKIVHMHFFSCIHQLCSAICDLHVKCHHIYWSTTILHLISEARHQCQDAVKAVHSLLIDKQLATLYTVHVRVGSNIFRNIQIFGQIIGVGDGT